MQVFFIVLVLSYLKKYIILIKQSYKQQAEIYSHLFSNACFNNNQRQKHKLLYKERWGCGAFIYNIVNDFQVRVEKCHYNPRNTTLETKLLFNDLTISGSVNLYRDSELERTPYKPEPVDTCNMILRLRKAGIGYVNSILYPHKYVTKLLQSPTKFILPMILQLFFSYFIYNFVVFF